ncbi:uncharacterized protein [Elaeis guineensis]|uniref:uncharacterized protein isoform X1 n=1 Tax=Elaeis guineensis var. tenera TaxID=51953 RepID=UPI003C6D7E8F
MFGAKTTYIQYITTFVRYSARHVAAHQISLRVFIFIFIFFSARCGFALNLLEGFFFPLSVGLCRRCPPQPPSPPFLPPDSGATNPTRIPSPAPDASRIPRDRPLHPPRPRPISVGYSRRTDGVLALPFFFSFVPFASHLETSRALPNSRKRPPLSPLFSPPHPAGHRRRLPLHRHQHRRSPSSLPHDADFFPALIAATSRHSPPSLSSRSSSALGSPTQCALDLHFFSFFCFEPFQSPLESFRALADACLLPALLAATCRRSPPSPSSPLSPASGLTDLRKRSHRSHLYSPQCHLPPVSTVAFLPIMTDIGLPL